MLSGGTLLMIFGVAITTIAATAQPNPFTIGCQVSCICAMFLILFLENKK